MSTTYVYKLGIFTLVPQKHNLKEYTYVGNVHQGIKRFLFRYNLNLKYETTLWAFVCNKTFAKNVSTKPYKI